MKKTIILLIVAIATGFSVVAQNAKKNMSIEGIPVKTSYASFVKQLVVRGYEIEFKDRNGCILVGLYGVNTIHVFRDTTNDMVSGAVLQVCDDGDVFYSRSGAQEKLEKQYNRFKAKLTAEYGNPYVTNENNTYYGYSNRNKHDETCDWLCNDGFVGLGVDNVGVKCCIKVFYVVEK